MKEHLRRDDEHERMPLALPEMRGEELTDLDGEDNQMPAGYLTLEIDVSELQTYIAAPDTAASQTDGEGRGPHEADVEAFDWPESLPEDMRLEAAELLEPEEAEFPGYLTI